MSKKRFRKLLPPVAILALILPSLFALAAPVSAATLCVNTTGTGGCYGSIQAAVNAAGDGDTIEVYSGTYDESVDLAQAAGDITVVAVDGPGTVTVNGNGGPAFHTSVLHSGDVTIDGFIANSPSSAGIAIRVNSDVNIRNVTANEADGDGIRVSEAGGYVNITDCTANDNGHQGIHLEDIADDVTITDCITNNNDNEGIDIVGVGGDVTITRCEADDSQNEHGMDIEEVGGAVTITDSTGNDNDMVGIIILGVGGPGEEGVTGSADAGDVTITNCDANRSRENEGIYVGGMDGDLTITDCTANENAEDNIDVNDVGGNATITRCTANSSDYGDGIEVDEVGGDLTITNCTANGNDANGFELDDVEGTVTIDACIARDNDDGVEVDDLDEADAILVNGSIICGNECGLYVTGAPPNVNAEGNWWGCPDGPEDGACDPICEDLGRAERVDFDPWIDTITPSAPASVVAGEPAEVTFQFSGGDGTVFLGEGPGDLRGPAPFTLTTDNGVLVDADETGATVHEFINQPDGVLAVALVADTPGTATVTLTGPCGLEGSIEVAVEAPPVVEVEFVPEPGSVMLLASGLMGLAGYASLRLRKK
jgi:parallel beta-helix repeat protein